jgi:hypothetical protein
VRDPGLISRGELADNQQMVKERKSELLDSGAAPLVGKEHPFVVKR